MEARLDALNENLRRLNVGRAQSKPLPNFGSGDFSGFMAELNSYLNANAYDEESALRLLPSLLHGEALRKYSSLPLNFRSGGPWNELIAALSDLIHTQDSRMMARVELQAVKQNGRDLDEYAEKVRTLARMAYPGRNAAGGATLPENPNNPFDPQERARLAARKEENNASAHTREFMALNAFTEGLDPELRRTVRRKNPSTIEEALSCAKQEHAFRRLEQAEANKDDLTNVVHQLSAQVASLRTNQNDRSFNYIPRDDYEGYRRTDRGTHWDNRQYRESTPERPPRRSDWDNRQYRERTPERPPRRSDWDNRHFREGTPERPPRSSDRDRSPYRGRGRGHGRGYGGYRHEPMEREDRYNNENNSRGRGRGRGRARGNNHRRQVYSVDIEPDTVPTRTGPSRAINALWTAMLILALTNNAHGMKFYLCTQGKGGVLIAPPPLVDCTPPPAVEHAEVIAKLFIANRSLPEIPAYKCAVAKYRLCTGATMFVPSYNRTLLDITAMQPEECRQLQKLRVYNNKPLLPSVPDVSRTPLPDIYPSTQFWGATCKEETQAIMEEGPLSVLTDETIITPLIWNSKGCHIQEGQCTDANTTVIWEPARIDRGCQFIQLGTFSAKLGGRTMVIERTQSAFTMSAKEVDKKVQACFEDKVYATTTEVFVIFDQDIESTLRQRNRREAKKWELHKIFKEAKNKALEYDLGRFNQNRKEGRNNTENVIGEMIVTYKLKFDDVARRIRWYNYTLPEHAIYHALRAKQSILDTKKMIQSIPVMELIPLVKEKARIEDRDMLQVFDEKDEETRIVLYQEMALKIAYSNQYPPEFDLDLELQQALPMNPIVVRQLRENKDNHTTGFIELTQRIFEKRRKDFQDWLNKAKKKSEERKTAKELGLYDPSITTTMSTPEKPSTSNKPSTTMMSTTTTVMSTTIKPIINAKQSTTIVPITITKMSTTNKPSTNANPSTTIIPTAKMSTTVKPSTNANPSTTMMPTTITKMSTTMMPTTSTKQNPASTTTPPSGANARNAEVLTTTMREPQSESEEKQVPDAIADSVRKIPRRPAEASSKVAGETNVVGSPSHIEYMKQTYDNQEQFRRNLTHSGVNSKLQFVAEKLQEDMKRNFEKAFEEACLMKNRLFIVWWAMTELNPTVAVRHILNRKDVIATFAGPEVVAISQCKTVVAKKIIYDHRINETCYAHTPIRNEQDETFFVIPGTRDLIRSSTVIECDKVQPSVFHVNGTYRAGDIAANVTRLHGIGPMMSTQLQRLNFNSTDIFEGAKGSAFPLTLAVSYGANLAALQRQQSELLHILVGQQFLSDKAKMLSEGTADFFHDATVAVDTVLTNTRNWMVNYLLGIGFVPVLIVICIFVCAIIFKLFAYRYFMNLMFGASKSLMVNNVNVVPNNNREEAYEMKEPSAPMLDQEVRIKQQGSQAAREQEAVHGQLLRPALPFFSYIPILLPAVFAATTEGSPGVLPYIPISLEDRGITALWDSGASISYTRLSTIHYLGIFNVAKTETKATTANGTKITFHGSVPLGVRIGNTYIDHEFLVSPDDCCPAAVLLGTDFMQKLEENCTPPTLHLTKGILTVGDVEIKLNQPGEVVYKQTNNVSQLTSRYSYRLTPGENKIITAKIRDEEVDPHHQWILLPEEESDISFGKIVFHPNEAEQIEFPVTNRGSTVVNIRAGQKIGHATKTEPIISALEGQELYIPPEADWEEKLPELTISTDFEAELNVKDCELSQEGLIELREIVARNKGAFYNGDGNIGCFTGPLEHSIELRTDMPFPRSRTYRIPLGKQAEVEKQVQTLLKQEIIEPSTSLFTSPIVLVKKRDDTFRFTTDFRQLNNVTRKQTYVIPHIHDIVDLAAGARFFSNLDLISGFFQIPLREKDRPLTAFTTTSGTYQYRRMPMGLCSSPHTFQCAVRILQSKVQCRLYTYLDDLLIVSDSEKGHLEDIEEVLKAIENLGMKIRLKKCTFGAAEVHFLGLIIGRQGVKPNPKKVQAIAEFPRPKTPTAVRSVIGMANYFRRFVKNFATIAHPLYELTTKTPETFVWEEHHEEAFEHLKKALSTAPVLASLTPNRPFIIESDGSTIAIGAVLLQSAEEGQQPHPIAYASRKLVKAERNYPPIEIEALALVFAVTEFRTYILGTKTTAITDHRPLTSLLKRKDLLGRLSKYQLVLQEYDIEITYRPGKSNDVGDALSRYCQDEQNHAQHQSLATRRSRSKNQKPA